MDSYTVYHAISNFCKAHSIKIGLFLIIVLSLVMSYNLYYHSGIVNNYHYFSDSASESKKRGAFLWEYIPNRDSIRWNGMVVEIQACYMEYDIYSHGNGKIRVDTTSCRERLIFNYQVGKSTKFSPYNYSALLKKYTKSSTMEYEDAKSLTRNDTLCLVF